MSVPFAAFASGSGTNLQALLNHERDGAAYRVELLVTDRECAAEERARRHGCAVHRMACAEGDGADGELLRTVAGSGAQGILLAGFLRLLPARVCAAYRDRILNIHPALLPSFGGRGMYGHHVHEAVLRSGAALSGPTVHFVDERYDEGRILAQWPVPVLPGDTAESLAARVLRVEHALYPEAANSLARAVQGGWPARGRGPSFRWPGDVTAATDPSSAPAAAVSGALRERIDLAFGGAR